MTCTFFGHRDVPDSILPRLRSTLVRLIEEDGADDFLVGTHGNFDALVRRTLAELREVYPHIRCAVVLAYLPRRDENYPFETLYPEGMETAPLRYAISRRNRWMLTHADCVVTYVDHSYGGAAAMKRAAIRAGLRTEELAQ